MSATIPDGAAVYAPGCVVGTIVASDLPTMVWPTWLVPPPANESRNLKGVSLGTINGVLALPACESGTVASPRDLRLTSVVVKPKPTTRIAPLHDLPGGSGSTWLVGRWVQWSVDTLNAIDSKTAATIPALKREAAAAKRRIRAAVQQEITNQFPPLQVYLADRAFALDELRNRDMEAESKRKRAEAEAATTKIAATATTIDFANVAVEPGLRATSNTTSTPALPMPHTTPQVAARSNNFKDVPRSPRRAKLTAFFAPNRNAGDDGAPERIRETEKTLSASTAGTVAKEAHGVVTTKEGQLKEEEDNVKEHSAKVDAVKEVVDAVEEHKTQETLAARSARWAREGAALAASLAASPKPKTPGRRRVSVTTDLRSIRPEQRVSRRRTDASAVPVPSAPRRQLAPPKPDASKLLSPTRLAAPARATMDRASRSVSVSGSENAKTRLVALPEPSGRRRDPIDDAARQERRAASRDARRGARRLGDENTHTTKPVSSFERRGTVRLSKNTHDAVQRMMATTFVSLEPGSASKSRRAGGVLGELTNTKGFLTKENAVSGFAAKIDAMRNSFASIAKNAAFAISELAEQAVFDGNGEFQNPSGFRDDKVRMEEVVTMSVDGADVLVQMRPVTVEGKQN